MLKEMHGERAFLRLGGTDRAGGEELHQQAKMRNRVRANSRVHGHAGTCATAMKRAKALRACLGMISSDVREHPQLRAPAP
eukprot:803373-Pleurochrysis_carterae.AAC.1